MPQSGSSSEEAASLSSRSHPSNLMDRIPSPKKPKAGEENNSLVMVLVAAVLFALAMSLAFRTNNTDMLTATARYAVVSVVFVGISEA